MPATVTTRIRARRSHAHAPPGHADHRRMHEAVWTRERALAVLESPERRGSEDPRALWRRVGLRSGMTVVDVGAGSGYYAVPASERVGPTGTVHAVDVSPSLVELLRERSAGRPNVHVVRSRPDRIPLPDGIADRVLLANLLHGVPPTTVAEAVRLLRPSGRLVDVDWKKEPTDGGPPLEHRLSAVEASRVLAGYGLTIVHESLFGPAHYVVVGEKGGPARPAASTPPRRSRGGSSARARQPRAAGSGTNAPES